MPHELGVSFHSQFALNAARHNYAAPTLRHGPRLGHKRIEFMSFELGSNSGNDIAAGGHKSNLAYSLYIRHRAAPRLSMALPAPRADGSSQFPENIRISSSRTLQNVKRVIGCLDYV
jgi:hypothetical protein